MHKMNIKPSPTCIHCTAGADDTAEHTLFHCPKFAQQRTQLSTGLNQTLNPDNIVGVILGDAENWQKFNDFTRERNNQPITATVNRRRTEGSFAIPALTPETEERKLRRNRRTIPNIINKPLK